MNYKSIKRKLIAVLLVLTIMFSVLPENNKKVSADENMSSVDNSGLSMRTTVESEWDGYHTTSFVISNNSGEAVDDWAVMFHYPYEIIDIWNAEIIDKYDGYYIIKNLGYNQDICEEGQVSFGCVCQNIDGQANDIEPSDIIFLGEGQLNDECDYYCIYRVTSDWGHGFNAELVVKNVSGNIIEDWSVEFEFENEINSIWHGVIKEHNGHHYVIGNASYNQNLLPGQEVAIGFNVSNGNSLNPINDCILKSINTNKSLNILTISDNEIKTTEDGSSVLKSGCSSISGMLDRFQEVSEFDIKVYDKNNILIFSEDIEKAAEWNTGNIGLSFGENTIVITARIGCMSDSKTIKVYQGALDLFQYMDVDWDDPDGDTLPNYLEDYFGTDKYKADTDNDGLNDFEELNYFGYDPHNPDTDNNGISDYDEDCDEDSLINGYELTVGSNPVLRDTDGDGLKDNEELEFGTSPTIEDTDSDGINDYDEYRFSKLNVEYDSDTGLYTCTFNAEDCMLDFDAAVVPSIKITGDKKAILTFDMSLVEHSLYLNASMTGYIGSAYEFVTEGFMSKAELTYTYNPDYIDDEMLMSEDFCPTIYYFDEETTLIEEVPNQVWEDNKITVELEHFSIYVLANKSDLVKMWSRVFSVEQSDNGSDIRIPNDIIFIIDRSGSMSWNDTKNIRADLLDDLCYRINEEDRVALYGFDTYLRDYSHGFLNNKIDIKNAINNFRNGSDNGGTYLNQAIFAAVNLFEADERENSNKVVFILTDGDTHDTISKSELTDIADKGIKIYTVGMGTVNENYLKSIADTTHGDYYYAKDITTLKLSFDSFEKEIVTDYDKNKDGIPEYYAKSICAGEITTYEGTHVFCVGYHDEGWEKIYEELQSNDDYDEDGLKNGEELIVFLLDGKKPYIKLKSNPELIDTDSDLISDYDELKIYSTNPFKKEYIVNSEDYNFISYYRNFESGKQHDIYLEKNEISISFEYFLNGLLGGELSLKNRTKEAILNTCKLYVEQTNNIASYEQGFIEITKDSVSDGFSIGTDLIPFIELGEDAYIYKKELNRVSKIVTKTRRGARNRYKIFLKKEFKNSLSQFKNAYSNTSFGNRIDKVSKKLAVLECIVDLILLKAEKCVGYEAARSCCNIIKALEKSNTPIVAEAAKNIEEQIIIEGAWLLPDIKDFEIITRQFIEVWIATKGIQGVLIDLSTLIASCLIGDSLEARIENSFSVDCSNGINSAIKNIFGYGKIKDTESESVYIINDNKEFDFDVCCEYLNYSRLYCEEMFKQYLEDDSIFWGKSHLFDVDENTYPNTLRNISILKGYYD